MAKKRAKRKKVVRKVVKPPTGGKRFRSLAAVGVGGGVTLSDVPPSDVGTVVQGMVNHGASDIRATIQSDGLWTVQKLS